MGKYTNLAKDIVTNVGGKENIVSLKHCITRLRFKLKDESIANDDILNNMDGVVTVMKAGGQYQVVIGNHVTQVFDEVNQVLGITDTTDSDNSEENVEKQGIFNAFIDVISGIFQPILVALSAAGVIKGFNTLFISLHWYSQTSGTYNVLNAIGDSMFTFLPILLGLTAAKKFNLNQYVGLIIGASLCYPAIQLDTLSKAGKPLYTLFSGTLFQSEVYQSFLRIPLISMNYTSTVIPVILICYFASKVEKSLNKVIPDMVKFFFVPIITLLVSLTLGFLVIGPLATFGSNLVGSAILAVRNFSPLVAGALVAGFWQVLVVFGLHWGIIPIYFNNIVTNGFDNVMMPYYCTTFITSAVLIAMLLKNKDKSFRKVAIPATISSLLGITEPAVYGVLIPKKKPLLISCIVSAIVGGFYGFFNLRKFAMGGMGFFELPGMIDPKTHSMSNVYIALIGIVLSFVLGFIATMIFWKEDPSKDKVVTSQNDDEKNVNVSQELIQTPLEGKVLPLSEVKDEVFSKGYIGKGLAIESTKGEVISPVNGTITTFFPTGHAIGITSDSGVEILIHVGMDTVNLEGKYFTPLVKKGDKVTVGQKLLNFDLEGIKKEGYSIITPVVVTNSAQYKDVVTVSDNGKNLLSVLV
ncbi:beta-glucoside-specific PTS transporter subunit IIABC [Ligilactobacillus salivarius]|uniref:beta-glucoside-specific PTS transporter subunit IIABC n=1 Tax=Ligilactobacillus salivarius TaxID=1624 RepID=UPI00136860C1|nr:beta-glucoside-specific PTS transporter subunit IIABC [Ligilactobacillus salivarius]MYU90221.1 PTS beta-glucoside transporter subunit IIABC [Ligilactobacillus salivarius]